QGPVGAGCPPVSERLHLPDVALCETQLDPGAQQRLGLARIRGARRRLPTPLDARRADEHAEPGRLVELHRVAARREVAAVDRDLAAGPHAIVAFEAQPVADDDVWLLWRRVGRLALAILDGRPLRGVHLDGIAQSRDGAPVLEVGSTQDRAVV